MVRFFIAVFLFTTFFYFSGHAQNNIGIGTANPDSSAALDVRSSNKGVLIPRLNATQRNAIAAPAAGLIIYNTTANNLDYWNGGSWIELSNDTVPAVNGVGINAGSSVVISTGTSPADQSSVLDIQSNTGGLLIPRMTAVQRAAIQSPVPGLLVFNTSANTLSFYSPSGWTDLCGASVSSQTGNITTTGNIGVNTSVPNTSAMLDVTSATAGFAIPRLTSAERDGILSPAQGLMIYNTTTQSVNIFNGSGSWLNIIASGTCWVCGDSLVDTRDGQSYATVQIGTQCWMAQNLNVGTFIPVATANQAAAGIQKYCSNLAGTADDATCPYGGLYEWYQLMGDVTNNNDQQIACDGTSYTASISGDTMDVTAMLTGAVQIGQTVTGTGVTPATVTALIPPPAATIGYYNEFDTLVITGTVTGSFALGEWVQSAPGPPSLAVMEVAKIMAQTSGTPGGAGNYVMRNTQNFGSETVSAAASTSDTLKVTTVATGVIKVGLKVKGTGIPLETYVIALGTGTGGTGTYILSAPINVTANTSVVVYGAAPEPIYAVPGGTGLYTISVSQNVASTTIFDGAFPKCTAPVQGICPTGWHVPAFTEWTLLERSINGDTSFEYNDQENRIVYPGTFGTNEGGALKQTGTANWTSPNTGATNSTGFSALPAGLAALGAFYTNSTDATAAAKNSAWFHSSTITLGFDIWYNQLLYDQQNIIRYGGYAGDAMSVRCIKN